MYCFAGLTGIEAWRTEGVACAFVLEGRLMLACDFKGIGLRAISRINASVFFFTGNALWAVVGSCNGFSFFNITLILIGIDSAFLTGKSYVKSDNK